MPTSLHSLLLLALASTNAWAQLLPKDGMDLQSYGATEGVHNSTWAIESLSDDFHLQDASEQHVWKRSLGFAWKSTPKLVNSKVQTGVAAMQIAVVGKTHVLIIDKSENNPMQVKGVHSAGGKWHPGWVQWLDVTNGKYLALDATTNSFCASGTFLSNGSMVSIGGNPRFNAASYYNANGLTALRIFKTCNDKTCTIEEYTDRVRLASARWYPSGCRLQDGSVAILGGMTEGGFNNAKETDNPTIEFYPSKSINNGLPVYSKFLANSLNSNLFPVTYLLPGGQLFVAANTRAMIYNWKTGKETMLPNFKYNCRVTYPWTAASTLLPMTIANKWVPEVLFCGGSTMNDKQQVYSQSSQTSATNICHRMQLNSKGIKGGWQIEYLPEVRVMGEAILTPDGKVLIVNGAKTGMAGYANVHNPIGQSNADHPDYRGVVYNPVKKKGQRMSTAMPSSQIPRMYHSVATLMPSGQILITGSNPNEDVTNKQYHTEYRMEFLNPPYMTQTRPTFTWCPDRITYGKSFKLIVRPQKGADIKTMSIILMDLGYHTHGVSVDTRLLELNWSNYVASNGQVLVKSPKDGTYYPPGRAWIFVVINGVPTQGQLTIVGDGKAPPFDKAANENMLKRTARTYGKPIW